VELQDEYPRIRGLGAELLAVSTDDRSDARNVVLQLGVGFPVLYDPDTKVARQYGVYNLLGDSLAAPATFVIDKEGRIRWSYIGRDVADRPSGGQILSQLRKLE
jgi:peroxiredoxin Q/BCP